MFAVIFEVQPKPDQWDAYLGLAGALRPELERIEGFVANERFGSKRRPGWLLSLSLWRDEKAVVRWRTHAGHHAAQERGRTVVFADYHLRVGEVTADSALPPGQAPVQQRFDATETGAAGFAGITEARLARLPAEADAAAIAARLLGFDPASQPGLVDWDCFESITQPGKFLALASWRDRDAAMPPRAEGHHRGIRIIRDYSLLDRAEAPQFYPPVAAR
jgi:heme-degrading monooxygenase HmoA